MSNISGWKSKGDDRYFTSVIMGGAGATVDCIENSGGIWRIVKKSGRTYEGQETYESPHDAMFACNPNVSIPGITTKAFDEFSSIKPSIIEKFNRYFKKKQEARVKKRLVKEGIEFDAINDISELTERQRLCLCKILKINLNKLNYAVFLTPKVKENLRQKWGTQTLSKEQKQRREKWLNSFMTLKQIHDLEGQGY
jgi:hypothetical protein